MHSTSIYGNNSSISKISSDNRMLCSANVVASSGPKAEGVPNNNQSGRGSGPCRPCEGFNKARHIFPTALLVKVQRL